MPQMFLQAQGKDGHEDHPSLLVAPNAASTNGDLRGKEREHASLCKTVACMILCSSPSHLQQRSMRCLSLSFSRSSSLSSSPALAGSMTSSLQIRRKARDTIWNHTHDCPQVRPKQQLMFADSPTLCSYMLVTGRLHILRRN